MWRTARGGTIPPAAFLTLQRSAILRHNKAVDLERDFAAWTDRRDPDALTRVFDATAGRLLLLALHVAGSGATAEDLVQATFLAAMARGSTWDRRRQLWPWLAAILQNEARMHWRRQQRRREVGLESTADMTAPALDPARLAASDEAFAAVVAAIDALPLPYRQVLRLRLVHGLQPIEIARALELPVGTVRAQVHRGLTQLREALPAGVVVTMGAWLTGDGTLLAQVRARVVAEATALQAGAASTSAGLWLAGGWIMQNKTVGLVAAAAALLLWLGFVLGWPSGFRAAEPPRPPANMTVGDRGAARPEPAPEQLDVVQRRAVVAANEPAWPLVVTVRTAAGEPIAGANVQVWVAARGHSIDNQTQGEGMREDVAMGLSAADGTFRCALDEFRSRTPLFRCTSYVFVAVARAGNATQQDVLGLPRTTEPRPFTAELELRSAFDIVGRVVDGSGAPVADARLFWQPAAGEDRFLDLSRRSHADGAFYLASPFGDGQRTGRIAAVDPVLGVGSAALPASESPPAVAAALDLGNIVLDGKHAIRGQVVLGDGSALGSMSFFVHAIDATVAKDPEAVRRSFYDQEHQRTPLRLRHGRLVQVVVRSTVAADGSFVCAGLEPEGVYAVAVRDTCGRMISAVAHVGGDPVRVVVDRQLLLLDVRGEGGELLRGANVVAEGFDPDTKSPADRIRPGFPDTAPVVVARFFPVDAQGRHMVLSPFGYVWRLGSFDEIALPDFVRHDAFPGVYRAERTITLRPETRFGSLHLAVVDEQGDPYQEFDFDLRCLDRDIQRNNRRVIQPADGMYRELPAGRWRLTVNMGKDLPYPPYWPKARNVDERDIVIEDGRTTEVKIVTTPLGRVGFRLRTDVSVHQLAELCVRSEPAGGEIAFQLLGESSDDAVRSRAPQLLTKHGLRSEKHWFVITAKGYQPAHCEAEVVADRAVTVEVELVRQ